MTVGEFDVGLRRFEQMRRRLDEQGDTPAFPAHLDSGARHTPALLDIVREALTENRVDLYLQPIVALPQRRTQFYESFSRLRDETGQLPIAPTRFYSFTDAEANTREQIAKTRQHPWISSDVAVRGFVFDVDTGRLSEVLPAAPPR